MQMQTENLQQGNNMSLNCSYSRALENIFSLLRPGGTAFVTFLSNYNGLGAYAELQALPKYRDYIKV